MSKLLFCGHADGHLLGVVLAVARGGLSWGDGTVLVLRLLVWVASTFAAARTVSIALRAAFRQHSGHDAPPLLLDMISLGLWLAALALVAVIEFEISPTAAFTTSGVLIAVVGFAVRSLLADLFYGMTMAIERPFEIGHWVKLNTGIIGRVDTMTWRAVKLVTQDNLLVVVPNASLASQHIINYDLPATPWQTRSRVVLDYGVPVDRVQRILEAAVLQVRECAALPHRPVAVIDGLDRAGVTRELRFWVPDYASATPARQRVLEALLKHLHIAGFRVAREQQELLIGNLADQREADRPAADEWIHHVALFAAVDEGDRSDLQRRSHARRATTGAEIVRQGEPGSSMFVVREGALDLLIEGTSGTAEKVGTLGPGAVFGELSLLTGEPRSATVRAATPVLVQEITHGDLEGLLHSHPELARRFAEIVTDRRLADARRARARSKQELDRERVGMIEGLLVRVGAFFSLADRSVRQAAE